MNVSVRKITGIEGLTAEDIERIAVDDGGLLVCCARWQDPIATGVVPFAIEWGTRLVFCRDSDYVLIRLVGNTERARRMLWIGKVRRLVDCGIPDDVARVCASFQFGMELPIARLANALTDVVEWCGPFRGTCRSEFEKWASGFLWTPEDFQGVTSFRLMLAAADIASEVVSRQLRGELAA